MVVYGSRQFEYIISNCRGFVTVLQRIKKKWRREGVKWVKSQKNLFPIPYTCWFMALSRVPKKKFFFTLFMKMNFFLNYIFLKNKSCSLWNKNKNECHESFFKLTSKNGIFSIYAIIVQRIPLKPRVRIIEGKL